MTRVTRQRQIRRHLTAVGRTTLSIGARSAFDDGLLSGTALDYGCGRGGDVDRLASQGLGVVGWDPHFRAETPLEGADAVLLTYVLNTIESVSERIATVAAAWRLTKRHLVVTVRLTSDRNRVRGEDYSDGVISQRMTFQHLFRTAELMTFLQQHTGGRPVASRPGVAYVFKNDNDRLAHLARRYGAELVELPDLRAAVHFMESRGRPPTQLDGFESSATSTALVKRAAEPSAVARGALNTTKDVLLFLALSRFQSRPRWSDLPPALQLDIRAHLGTYQHACWRADRLLRQLSDRVTLRQVMRVSVGKGTPSAQYIHRRALGQAPVLLRLYEECAALASGRPEEWDIVKLHHDRAMVSWLDYPDFDRDPHPRLVRAYRMDLKSLDAEFADYGDRENPPVLHRKEEFLGSDDDHYETYARLTRQELRAGLYEHPETIGTLKGWQAELLRHGKRLRGHRLINSSP